MHFFAHGNMVTLYQRIYGSEPHISKEGVLMALAPGRELSDYLTNPRRFLIDQKIETTYPGLARYIENYFSERRVHIPDTTERITGKGPEHLHERLMWSFRARKNATPSKHKRQEQYSQHEPLRKIIYGTIRANNLPDEIFRQMDAWEAMYFLAGVWNRMTTTPQRGRFSRPILRRQNIPQIIVETVEAGINYLERYMNETRANKALPHYAEVLGNLGIVKTLKPTSEQMPLF